LKAFDFPGAVEVVPERYRLHVHHWLILHCRYVCVARRDRRSV
jgi:endonuclease-3